MRKDTGGVTVECVQGDIASQDDCLAVVNAANAWLRPGGGVAGAIHRKAGPQLYEECKGKAPIKPGEAVITKGYNLPNRYCIHCLGPVYGKDTPSDKILSNCYRNCLKLADEYKIDSIAFCAISTGIFGYPLEEAARVSLVTIKEVAGQLKYVKKIRFVLYDKKSLETYEKVMREVLG